MSNLVDLAKWLNELPVQLEPQRSELYHAATGQQERILARTVSGISVDLQPFAPYSPATGKNPPVNLTESGDMLASMTVIADNDEAHVLFADEEQAQIARYHNEGTDRLPQRFFFGVSLQDREDIIADIRAGLFRRVNDLG
ncbi:MAG TPA: hypothetical protein VN736_01180 [Candidatus Limnocylindrales bacterium]|nr:hypothetical protein [Candidatus Limnocylindrales bacterium]